MKVESFTYTDSAGWSGALGANDSERTLVAVFGAFAFHEKPEVFDAIAAAYPSSHVIGCSTSGELSDGGFETGTLSLMVMHFEHSDVVLERVELTDDTTPLDSGKQLIDRLTAREELSAVFLLSNSVSTNGSRFIEGMNAHLPEGATLFGGVASAFESFEKMWTLMGTERGFSHAVAAGIYGPAVRVSHGTRGGWDPLGPLRKVTRSEENVVYELDGQPALDVYIKYLGKHADGLPQSGLFFPLELQPPNASPIIRAVTEINEDARALVLLGDVPEGSRARLMRGSMARLLDGAEGAIEDAMETAHEGDAACLAVSCIGRRVVLGEQIDEEQEIMREGLPESVRLAGFYSHGEFAPRTAGATCDHHNQTISVTVISEAQA